jgi:hypothetical protein
MRRWRPWQFSLRALFVLMTAAAVWIGLLAHQAREQKKGVQAIRQAGGYADRAIGKSPW